MQKLLFYCKSGGFYVTWASRRASDLVQYLQGF